MVKASKTGGKSQTWNWSLAEDINAVFGPAIQKKFSEAVDFAIDNALGSEIKVSLGGSDPDVLHIILPFDSCQDECDGPSFKCRLSECVDDEIDPWGRDTEYCAALRDHLRMLADRIDKAISSTATPLGQDA